MFSCFLAGCNTSNSVAYADYRQCYERVDIGYSKGRKTPSAALISRADPAIFRRLIPAHILTHVRPLPQIAFNGYIVDEAKFIVHFAGPRDKADLMVVVEEAKKTHPSVYQYRIERNYSTSHVSFM